MRDTIIEAAGTLFTIGVIGYIFLVVWYLATHQQEPATPDDPDFERFYLDLLGADLTVDYTREEAQGLYRMWLRQEKVTN